MAEERPGIVTWQAIHDDLGLSRQEVEADLALLNLVNFGGGTYALWTEADDDGVRVTRDVMADTFVHPARLSPLMARALLLALDLLGDALGLEGAESLASVRHKIQEVIGEHLPDTHVLVDDVIPAAHDVMTMLNEASAPHGGGARLLHPLPGRAGFPSDRTVPPLPLPRRMVRRGLLPQGRQPAYVQGGADPGRPSDRGRLHTSRRGRPEPAPVRQAFSPGSATSWAHMRFAPRWRTYLEDRGLECETWPTAPRCPHALSRRALDGAGGPPLPGRSRARRTRDGPGADQGTGRCSGRPVRARTGPMRPRRAQR